MVDVESPMTMRRWYFFYWLNIIQFSRNNGGGWTSDQWKSSFKFKKKMLNVVNYMKILYVVYIYINDNRISRISRTWENRWRSALVYILYNIGWLLPGNNNGRRSRIYFTRRFRVIETLCYDDVLRANELYLLKYRSVSMFVWHKLFGKPSFVIESISTTIANKL